MNGIIHKFAQFVVAMYDVGNMEEIALLQRDPLWSISQDAVDLIYRERSEEYAATRHHIEFPIGSPISCVVVE